MIIPEYITLFNAITKAVEALEAIKMDLMVAQYNAEEDYISKSEREATALQH